MYFIQSEMQTICLSKYGLASLNIKYTLVLSWPHFVVQYGRIHAYPLPPHNVFFLLLFSSAVVIIVVVQWSLSLLIARHWRRHIVAHDVLMAWNASKNPIPTPLPKKYNTAIAIVYQHVYTM